MSDAVTWAPVSLAVKQVSYDLEVADGVVIDRESESILGVVWRAIIAHVGVAALFLLISVWLNSPFFLLFSAIAFFMLAGWMAWAKARLKKLDEARGKIGYGVTL